jgi:hypothetical protein
MTKRRTKKQKLKARYPFLLSSKLATKTDVVEPNVKREFSKAAGKTKVLKEKSKLAKYTVQAEYLGTIKKDIIKSLVLVALILSLEIVIYFFWRN